MKFSNGYWLMREGVTPAYAAQAYDVVATQETLAIYAATRRVEGRGDTLNSPMITVELSSPMPDIVRVAISHFQGGVARGPQFVLADPQPGCAKTRVDNSEAVLTSGALSARIDRGARWRLSFLSEAGELTASDDHSVGYLQVNGRGSFVHEQLALGVGECVYGLGEHFGAFVKNGQVVDVWNEDGGTASEQAYKSIPFYMTNRGYGVFIDHPGRVSFEVASEKVKRVQFSVPGQSLAYYIIYGPTPKEVLLKYTALTGRPALPPAWSFGLWLTTSFTTSYDERTITQIVKGMADRRLPLHVFHFDTFWMREFCWCDFVWDTRVFPDPGAMLARLRAQGLHISVWLNPYIAQRSVLFVEAMREGYLVKKPNGDVWQIDLWQPGMGIVDFTNPRAREWFAAKLQGLMSMGVDCFKADFGERIPVEASYCDGSDPERMHNYYAYLYQKTVFETLRDGRGPGDAVIFARAATVGCQQFPVHWGGDCESSFEAMAESLRGGLSLCMSGFGFWSHDIGGFEGTPNPAVYKRWIAFGLLSSHSRLHGSTSYRVPWLFDEESVDVLRFFTRLKCTLMPYLFANAVDASRTGVPLMRPMFLEFPDDPACAYLDRQYMLGGSLLVAPVFSAGGNVEFYLPQGAWTNLLDGRVQVGPRWCRETHGFMGLPLYAREGSLLAIGGCAERPDYDYGKGLTLRAYGVADGTSARATIPALDGSVRATFEIGRTGDSFVVSCVGEADGWTVLLVGVHGAASCAEGQIEMVEQGILATPKDGARQLRIGLTAGH